MFRYLLTSFALAAQLIAAGPVLADAAKAAPAATSEAKPAASVVPCSSTTVDHPDRRMLGVVGQGWG